MATFEEQSDQISALVDDMQNQALQLKDDTLGAIDDISTALQTMLDAIEAVEYDADTTGITFNYVAPTATAATIPTASEVAIGDVEWDRINDNAAADLALVGVGEEAAAADEASWRGLSIPALVSAALVSEAEQRTMDRISQGRLNSVTEQAKAAREDAISLSRLNVDNYTAQINAQVSSLAEERGWKNSDVARIHEEANRTAQYILERTRLIEQKSVEVNTSIAQLMSGVTQAFLTAVDAGMRSSVSIGLSGDA